MKRQKPLTELFRTLFKSVILLSGDPDSVIQELFGPLLDQLIHWFTRKQSEETEALLDCLMETLSENGIDPSERKKSASALEEFMKWSIKQSNPVKGVVSGPLSSLVDRINALWAHPTSEKRLGASLAFNGLYRYVIYTLCAISLDTFFTGCSERKFLPWTSTRWT